jgi:hypothetical protein
MSVIVITFVAPNGHTKHSLWVVTVFAQTSDGIDIP